MQSPQPQTTNANGAISQTLEEALTRRIDVLTQWLADNAEHCADEQAHLDADSRERAYWNYGYLVALRDVRNLLVGKTSALN